MSQASQRDATLTFKHEFEIATEGRNEERDLLSIIKTMAENRMVRYRDASTESKYDSEGNSNVEEYESEEYEEHSYTSSETSGFSIWSVSPWDALLWAFMIYI